VRLVTKVFARRLRGPKFANYRIEDKDPKQIKEIFQLLLGLLVGTIHLLPEEFIDVGIESAGVVEEHMKGQSRIFLIGFFFIRFLCPALAFPDGEPSKLNLVMTKILKSGATAAKLEGEGMELVSEYLAEPETELMFEAILSVFQKEPLKSVAPVIARYQSEFNSKIISGLSAPDSAVVEMFMSLPHEYKQFIFKEKYAPLTLFLEGHGQVVQERIILIGVPDEQDVLCVAVFRSALRRARLTKFFSFFLFPKKISF
jgi:hypothetical protein